MKRSTFNSIYHFCLFLSLICLLPVSAFCEKQSLTPKSPPRVVAGWVEKIKIFPGELILHSKLEAGVPSSEIHAEQIEPYLVDGKKWVRFLLHDRYGKDSTVEKKVTRILKTKDKESFVVKLGICIGNEYVEHDFLLADRTQMEYEMRLGRQAIEGLVIIDPGHMFTLEPNCKAPKLTIKNPKKDPTETEEVEIESDQ